LKLFQPLAHQILVPSPSWILKNKRTKDFLAPLFSSSGFGHILCFVTLEDHMGSNGSHDIARESQEEEATPLGAGRQLQPRLSNSFSSNGKYLSILFRLMLFSRLQNNCNDENQLLDQ
jgi:hypothetical protein